MAGWASSWHLLPSCKDHLYIKFLCEAALFTQPLKHCHHTEASAHPCGYSLRCGHFLPPLAVCSVLYSDLVWCFIWALLYFCHLSFSEFGFYESLDSFFWILYLLVHIAVRLFLFLHWHPPRLIYQYYQARVSSGPWNRCLSLTSHLALLNSASYLCFQLDGLSLTLNEIDQSVTRHFLRIFDIVLPSWVAMGKPFCLGSYFDTAYKWDWKHFPNGIFKKQEPVTSLTILPGVQHIVIEENPFD